MFDSIVFVQMNWINRHVPSVYFIQIKDVNYVINVNLFIKNLYNNICNPEFGLTFDSTFEPYQHSHKNHFYKKAEAEINQNI